MRLALTTLFVMIVAPLSALAQSYTLESYQAPPECPARAVVARQLAAIAFNSQNSIEIDVIHDAGEYRATIRLNLGQGGEERVLSSASCDGLVASLELLLRMRATRVDLRPTSSRLADPNDLAIPAEEDPTSVDAITDSAPEDRWHLAATLFGGVDVGTMRHVAGAAGVRVFGMWHELILAIDALALPYSTVEVTTTDDARVGMTLLGAFGAPALGYHAYFPWGAFSLLAGVEVGLLRGEARLADSRASTMRLWIAPRVVLSFEFIVWRMLSLVTDLSVSIPATEPAFELTDGTSISRSLPAIFRSTVGLAYYFR